MELDNIFETDRGTAGVLITGEPGSGKSALMSQLICSPYSSLIIHENIIGYHLCEHSEKGKRNGARFVRNLVDQIAARLPGYSEHVIKNKNIRRELDILCQQDVTGCFFTSILGLLRKLKPPDGLRYIVIDALDECFESDKTSEIVEILSNKIQQLPKWLKVILTSRNQTTVTTRIPRVVRRMPLYANDDRNVKDIRFYVSRFISQNSFFLDRLLTAMNIKSRTYGMKVFLDEVITRAEGNFLFIKMALQYMNDTDEVVGRSLPTSLFDLYNHFFKRQFGNDGFGPFRFLFEVLLSVGSPLQLSDVEEILWSEYETKDISQLVEQASSFLRFGRDGTVRIYHQSFAEWLINQSAAIHINKTRAHQNIAKFLLRRIREEDMNVIFGEVIELFMQKLSEMTYETYENTTDLFNITEMREPRTNQSILHHLAVKPRPFHPVLQFFLPKFKTVNILDASKKTPAFYAASEDFVENLRSFINRGADVSSFLEGYRELDPFLSIVRNTGIEEYSLIHAAAAKGHRDVVELLIKSNVSFHELSKNYPTSLHLAAGNGHLEVLRLFYDYGAKFDVITLHHAAAKNHLDVVEFLLRTVGVRDTCLQCTCQPGHLSKFSVEDVHQYFCETALHAAVSRRYIDIVKVLLAFGNESLECKHHSGKTVLMDAVARNDTEMVDLLLENGANVTTQCGSQIPKRNKIETCSLYSTHKQDFLYTVYCAEDSCNCGNTAIHVSAKYGLWKVAEKLTSKHVFYLTQVKNCAENDAWDVAVSHGHTNFIYHINETYGKYDLVLNESAVVRAAVLRSFDNVVKYYLEYPITYLYERRWEILLESLTYLPPYDLYMFGKDSRYICPEVYGENIPLAECAQRVSQKHLAIIMLLIESYKSYKEKSFILNKKDSTGMTLLHHAAKNGFEDAVKYLAESGADTRIKNRDGDSPLTLALKQFPEDTSPNRNAWYRCYTTNDGQFGSCNTTNYDEIVRYLIWWERSNLSKCDARSASLLNMIISKQMPLSLYELLKAGVDMNCLGYNMIFRPFIRHLILGGRQLSEVFIIFEVDISSLLCPHIDVSFIGSELHLISYLAQPDDLGDFFKPLGKRHSPLQRLIDEHPDGVGILDKCYDREGYLPIHRAAQGGNLAALKWFKSTGVNTQLKTKTGLTALDISILYLGDISQAELIASPEISPYPSRNNKLVPPTTPNYRSEVFEELLRTFFSETPEYRSEFPCGASLEGLSPLHIAAVKGMTVLRYVHKKASKIFPNLPLNCANKHRLDPVYVAHFYESLINEGLIGTFSEDSNVHFEQETKTSKNGEPKNKNKIKNRSQSDRTNIDGKNGYNSMPQVQYPKRDVEYYMAFDYLFHPLTAHRKDEFVEETMLDRRQKRQISQFIAKRLSQDDVGEVITNPFDVPYFFVIQMFLNEHKSLEYLRILNAALEVADIRFYSLF